MGLYDNLQNSFNIITSTTLGNMPSFMTQASPLQTQILGSMVPQNLQLPDFNVQMQNQSSWSNYQKQQQLDKTGMAVSSQGITTNRGSNGSQIISSATKLLNDVALPAISKSNNLANFGNIKNLTPQQATQVGLTPSSGDPIVNQLKDKVAAGAGSSTGGRFKDFMNSGAGAAVGAAANLVGGLVNQLGNNVGAYSKRPEAQQLNETQEAVRSAVYSGVSAIPGFGPLISGGLQLADGLGKMLGTQMSNISKDAAEDAGLSRGFNNVMATVPLVGSFAGLFTKKTAEFEIDRDRLAGVGSGYDMSTFDSAEDLSGGKFVGQRRKVNSFIAEQNRKKDMLTEISDTQKLRKAGMSSVAADLAQQNKNRYSGYSAQQFALGRNGMKFPDLNWARDFLIKYKEGGKLEIPEFQKGGKLGTPGLESNVIVEGAYHAHKNHLDEVNPELSDMTPKGIPVATEDASGNKTQVAEIEVGELILTKDLTDKLEELYKDGSDEAAIQAGILFANEIIDNTVDNKGGVLDEDN